MASNGGGIWNALAENAPKILFEAAQSGLGIIALVVLVLAVLAVIFFWKDQPRIKLSVFGALIFVFVGLGLLAVLQEAEKGVLAIQDGSSKTRCHIKTEMVVQKGQNIAEKPDVNRFAHFLTNELDKCRRDCETNPKCLAFAYRHLAEGSAYPNECWLYGEPRDKFYTKAYHPITSGIKKTTEVCD